MAAEDALQQRLQWLEEERRKDHSLLLALQERLISLEGDYRAVNEQLKGVSSELAQVSAALGQFEKLEGAIARIEQESARRDEELTTRLQKQLREAEENHRAEVENLRERVREVYKKLEQISPLQRALAQRQTEIQELRQTVETLTARLDETEHMEEERLRAIHLLQEAQERTAKRMVDVQGEVTAFRKRLDDQAAQVRVFNESLRKLEARLQEMLAEEYRRKQEQTDFVESQNRRWLAWERTWKEWETRFQALETLSQQVEARLRAWDDLQREVKRAQEGFETMTDRLERRMHEITEIQRLAEDRFRQEWAAFKADDQKRWANYLLAQDEHRQDIERRLASLDEQVVQLQDALQALDDVVKMGEEQLRQRLQALVKVAQTWLNDYERASNTVKNS